MVATLNGKYGGYIEYRYSVTVKGEDGNLYPSTRFVRLDLGTITSLSNSLNKSSHSSSKIVSMGPRFNYYFDKENIRTLTVKGIRITPVNIATAEGTFPRTAIINPDAETPERAFRWDGVYDQQQVTDNMSFGGICDAIDDSEADEVRANGKFFTTKEWTNAYWIKGFEKINDRWQMKFDGADLVYWPEDELTPYIPCVTRYHVYTSMLTHTFYPAPSSTGGSDKIEYSLTLTVGRKLRTIGKDPNVKYSPGRVNPEQLFIPPTYLCRCTVPDDTRCSKTYPVERTSDQEQAIYIECDTPERKGTQFFPLLNGADTSMVENYTAYNGITYPFEYLTLTIGKMWESRGTAYDSEGNVVVSLVNEHGEPNFQSGRSRIIMRGKVNGVYTISQVENNGTTISIRAYTQFESLRSKLVAGTQNITVYDAFVKATRACGIDLNQAKGNVFEDGRIKSSDRADNPNDRISIADNTYAWRIIQICAIHMGWRIFFTGTEMWVIYFPRDAGSSLYQDYKEKPLDSSSYSPFYINNLGHIRLHYDGESVWDRSIGELTSPTNNADSLKYSATISYKSGEGNATVFVSSENDMPPADDSNTIYVPEYTNAESARHFGLGLIKYTSKVSRAVSFKLDEGVTDSLDLPVKAVLNDPNLPDETIITPLMGYERTICNPAIAESIESRGTTMAYSNGGNPLTMILTSAVFEYPSNRTTYTFGENKSITLDSSLSEIRSAKK